VAEMAMVTSPGAEQATAENALPAEPQLAEPDYGSAGSRRRIYRLLEETFGPSRHAQIQGLLSMRRAASDSADKERPSTASENTQNQILSLCAKIWGAPENIVASLDKIYHGTAPGNTAVRTASDAELKAAYERGRSDLTAEIVFAERLAAIRAKYSDFDACWNRVRPLVPRVVWEEAAELEHGLEGAYQLSKLPELATELAALEPENARARFRFFVHDLVILMRGTQQ